MTVKDTTAPSEAKSERRSLAPILIGVIALGFVALLVYGLMTAGDKRVESGQAPNFAMTTFDGKPLSLADLRGQVVVVNFWATWCTECEKEASDLEQVWRDYQAKGVQFVGIDYLDQAPLNQEYLDRYDITYPNGPDLQGRAYQAYGVQGLPETFVIDQQGAVRKVFIGAASREALAFEIEKLLAEQS
jgi:cytochrome c biogenesis protein CcmG/thiol:disulfide interchange protein DsbE